LDLYICLISIHGLIRGENLELARALDGAPGVERIDLFTRLVDDDDVSDDYAVALESLGSRSRIVRILAGPPDYIPKELLWDHLDAFADNAIDFFRESGRFPDLLHSHYADAGYVGSRISHAMGIPLVHTGHSLGRVKRSRLLASGLDAEEIEQRYNMSRRTEAEETTLASAELVITSTNQEIEEQYGRYNYYQPDRMKVIPPGIDLAQFHPPEGDEWQSDIAKQIARFLREPEKPIILAVARPDTRKNLSALVTAYGKDESLRSAANLVIVAGNRDDIRDLDDGAQEVLLDILYQADRLDIYGRVAYPKHHAPDDVPMLYRLAALTGGVFVNPALTEPFGLTLLEAAASGLPIVATEDGGPRDIIQNCNNGVLVNPLDPEDIARGVSEVLRDWESWQQLSMSGLSGVRQFYSWDSHVAAYLEEVRSITEQTRATLARPVAHRTFSLYRDRAIFTDLDQSLLSDTGSLPRLIDLIRTNRNSTVFGIATGRRLDSTLAVLKKFGIPEPDVLITSCGTEIHYAPELTRDESWTRHIEKLWTPSVIRRVLESMPGLLLQPRTEQSQFKISYYIDPRKAPPLADIVERLHQEEQSANVILSFGQFLDVLPMRASKGLALRNVAARWGISLERVLVAGGSGADEDMMRGNTLAVVVGNRHHEELSMLEDLEQIYFADAHGAGGILEAIEFYDFYDQPVDARTVA
jgi:sucrose-phosphate synthase